MYQALARCQVPVADFRDWCVVAVPRSIGRLPLANALTKFRAEGAWGVSPHLIPHRSLHSVSGTISQALKIHGPNFGVGGGPGGAGEGLLTAATLVVGDRLPGVWLVLTGWRSEPTQENQTDDGSSNVCQALALALTAYQPGRSGWHLTVARDRSQMASGRIGREAEASTEVSLEALQEVLEGRLGGPTVWPLQFGGWVSLAPSLEPHESLSRKMHPTPNGTSLRNGTERRP
jgi:hypothetical protein